MIEGEALGLGVELFELGVKPMGEAVVDGLDRLAGFAAARSGAAAAGLVREGDGDAEQAAEQQSQVAEEMTRSVIGIRDVTEQTVGQTLDSAAISDQLAGLASDLAKAIQQLKL